jgi:hypothetical protein
MALFAIIKFYSAAPRAEMVVAGNWRILAGAGWRDKSWRSYFSKAYTIVQVSSRSVLARHVDQPVGVTKADTRLGKIRVFDPLAVKLPPIVVAADQKPTAHSLSQSYT